MTRTFAAAMRRVNRSMTRPVRLATAARSIQKAMTGLAATTALTPVTARKAKPAAKPKAATKPKTARKPKTTKPRKARMPKAGHSLGAVLSQFRAMTALMPGVAAPPSAPRTPPRIPEGAQYLARTHRSAAGSRGYTLFLPAGQAAQPRGLILMLHGCTQSPDDFAAGTHMNALAGRQGFAVAYPAQTRQHNAASCWNWFSPANQMRGAGEPAMLASLTRRLMREFGLERDAVFVAGLSAGGAMAAILADLYPDVYAAAGVHSGLARGAAHDVFTAMSAMRNGAPSTLKPGAAPLNAPSRPVRRIVFQGDADNTVHPANAAMIVAAAVGEGAVAVRTGKRTAGGRGYTRSEYAGPDGAVLLELWMIEGAGHAWSGGRAAGSYTDRSGPDASAQMIRFFMAQAG